MYGPTRIIKLKNWRNTVQEALSALSDINYIKEIYVFGSVIKGEITGASDIDLAIVIQDKTPQQAKIELEKTLEEKLGQEAYIYDLHIIPINHKHQQPYSQILKQAIRLK